MESLPEIIEKSDLFETDEDKLKWSSSSSLSSVLLPDLCIFCDKDVKYKKIKPKQHRKCEAKQVRDTLEKYAKDKNCYRIFSRVSTHHIIPA